MSANNSQALPPSQPSQEPPQSVPAEVPVPASVSNNTLAAPPTTDTAEAPSPGVEKADNGTPRKGGWPKGKKRKKAIKDVTAPRQPLTGYVRFLNDRREPLRAENPSMPFAEITKVLAAEWSSLPQDQKQQYLTAAEQDRERYLQELKAYKQSEAYRIFSEQQKDQSSKKAKEEGGGDDSFQGPENNDTNGCDIPIFTEDFLDHNKSREAELRQLRKSNTDYEQQNATIQTYISGLHTAIEKYTVETQQQRNNNNALRQYLSNLKVTFTNVLAPINVPNLEKPSLENIESYMTKLLTYVKENPQSSVTANIRKAVAELDLQA